MDYRRSAGDWGWEGTRCWEKKGVLEVEIELLTQKGLGYDSGRQWLR